MYFQKRRDGCMPEALKKLQRELQTGGERRGREGFQVREREGGREGGRERDRELEERRRELEERHGESCRRRAMRCGKTCSRRCVCERERERERERSSGVPASRGLPNNKVSRVRREMRCRKTHATSRVMERARERASESERVREDNIFDFV